MTGSNGSEPASAPEDQPEQALWPVHASVDLDSPGVLCVAAKRDGERCRARAAPGGIWCNAHAGRLDSSAGGHALASKRRQARRRAEEEAAFRALGTRALVAQKLSQEATKVEQALDHLLTAAAAGDIRSAQALLPWIDQGLGKPTERIEQAVPSSRADLDAMGTAALEALVKRGRERLKAV
jgi:hypothetical protein